MFLKAAWISIAVTFVCLVSPGADLVDAQALISHTANALSNNFSAEMDLSGSKMVRPTHMRVWRRIRPDGDAEMRLEIGDGPKRLTNLYLPEGAWTVLPNTAIKLNYLSVMQQSKAQFMAGLSVQMPKSTDTLNIQPSATNDSYYIITKTLGETSKATTRLSLDAPKVKEIMEQNSGLTIPEVERVCYVISKKDSVLTSYTEFGAGDLVLLDIQYKNVSIGTALSNDLFRVPENLPRRTANSQQQYLGMLTGHDMTDSVVTRGRRTWIVAALIVPSIVGASFLASSLRSRKNQPK